jgi:hypothetical protein
VLTVAKDLLTLLMQFGLLCVAIAALETWRRQLKGTTAHAAAVKVASEAKTLSNLFFEARSPMFKAWEFPASYYAEEPDAHSDDDEADAIKHVYNNRLQHVWPHIIKLAQMRGEIGAVLGDDVADAAEKLARIAEQLKSWMERDVELHRAGNDFVDRIHDKAYVARVRSSVVMEDNTPTDPFSLEFIRARDALLALVRPHLT